MCARESREREAVKAQNKIMKLSVIVPVYNMAAEKKLEFCLDSLVNQTISEYEIIAVDDCSTDDTYNQIKK